MCPSCVISQVGLSGGLWLALFVCALFFAGAMWAMVWAAKSGQFHNVEGVKYRMLDVEDDFV